MRASPPCAIPLSLFVSLTAHAETPAPETPAAATAAPGFHLGIDGVLGSGSFAYSAIGLRAELAVKREGFVVLRASYLHGDPLDENRSDFNGGLVTLGYRGYAGPTYASLETGVLFTKPHFINIDDVLRPDGSRETREWETDPRIAASLGRKIGALDLGVSVAAPQFTISLSLGVDLSSLIFSPRRDEIQKQRRAAAVARR